MDNLCHTLVGAALAEAGLKRRTRLGAATLMIGANFPDIDIVAVPFGASLSFRRGWTHGVLALVVLPFVLTAIMLWWDRRRARRTHTPASNSDRARPRALLLLSTLSILTHPALDFLNSYGVRWLMPFSSRWFYGDSLFIVDPWLLVILLGGIVIARRTAMGVRVARAALGVAIAYVTAMVGISAVTRARVLAVLGAPFASARELMVAPVPIDPFRRQVIYDRGDRYDVATVDVFGTPFTRGVDRHVAKGMGDVAVVESRRHADVQTFLSWARFPYFEVARDASGVTVRAADARYAMPGDDGWASVTIRLPRVIASPPRR
jgi:inner membrane protein